MDSGGGSGSCVVSGAGRGIGQAVAVGLAARGWRVLALDVGCGPDGAGTDKAPVVLTRDKIEAAGGTVIADAVDVANADDVDAAVCRAVDRWGPIDAAINVAGVLRLGTLETTPTEDWQQLFALNVLGAVNVARSVVASWPDGHVPTGRIINFTSAAGLEGHPEMAAYSTSKAALIGFTQSTANALAGREATVNAVAPIAATRMAVRGLGMTGSSDELEAEAKSALAPMDIDAEAVVPLIAYLVSPAAAAYTGRVFSNNGWRYFLLGERTVAATVTATQRSVGSATSEIAAAFESLDPARSRWSTTAAPDGSR